MSTPYDNMLQDMVHLVSHEELSEEAAAQLIAAYEIAKQVYEVNSTLKDILHYLRTPDGGML